MVLRATRRHYTQENLSNTVLFWTGVCLFHVLKDYSLLSCRSKQCRVQSVCLMGVAQNRPISKESVMQTKLLLITVLCLVFSATIYAQLLELPAKGSYVQRQKSPIEQHVMVKGTKFALRSIWNDLIVFVILQNMIVSQDDKAEVLHGPASRPELVQLLFEEGKGVPLLSFDFTATGADQKNSEIYVWSNGRIHWRDYSKRNSHSYFEAKITEGEVSELFKKVLESRNRSLQSKPSEPGTKHKLATQVVPLVLAPTSTLIVSSPTCYENNTWSVPLLHHVIRDKDIFNQKNQEQILEHLASLDAFNMHGQKGFLRVILYNYYCADPNNIGHQIELEDTDKFLTEEVEKYVGRFIADARHFLYCKELIESLMETVIAQKETRVSAPLGKIIRDLIWVVEKNDNVSVQYEYIPASLEDIRRQHSTPYGGKDL